MQIWDADEVNIFLATVKDTSYYALFFTALYTGARRGELLALKWSDIDTLLCTMSINKGLHYLRDRTFKITQPKTKISRRMVSLTPDNVMVLKDHREKQKLEKKMLDIKPGDDDLVFAMYDEKYLRPQTVSRAWENVARRAGVKVIRFHDSRHTNASLLLKQGVHPKVVQERLEHSTINTTLDIYSHVSPGLQEATALRFDDMLKVSYNEKVAT